MPFELPPLPYDAAALAPFISKETIDYHYGKHHQAYVNNLNQLIRDTEFEGASLEDIIKKSSAGIFNNAAQVWNHTFYWHSLTPKGKEEPQGALAEAIAKKYGSFADFKQAFTKSSISLFGSGWCWLVRDDKGNIDIVNTSNAGTPLTTPGQKALLTCDVWEHAYYIDVRNARPQYLENFWRLANWSFAEENFEL